MAKLKTRTNQPVIDDEGLLDHIAQEGNTTQIGGNLEVDGQIPIDLTSMPLIEDLLDFSYLTENERPLPYVNYSTPYSKQQILSIIGKYYLKGITSEEYVGVPLKINQVKINQNWGEYGDSFFLSLYGIQYLAGDDAGRMNGFVTYSFYANPNDENEVYCSLTVF